MTLPQQNPSREATGRTLTVLVLEDHPDYRQLMSLAVRRLGHNVVEAADGIQALGYLLRHERPDLIFCDFRMPDMDGEEFIRALRARESWASIPVLMISAEPQAADVARSFGVPFLQKGNFSPLRDLPEQVRLHALR